MGIITPKLRQPDTPATKPSTTPEQLAIIFAVLVTIVSGMAVGDHVSPGTWSQSRARS